MRRIRPQFLALLALGVLCVATALALLAPLGWPFELFAHFRAQYAVSALLIALLLPSARKVMESAKSVNCKSNLKQINLMLVTYANDNKGVLFPTGPEGPGGAPKTLGSNVEPWYRWPMYVFPELRRKVVPPTPLPPISIRLLKNTTSTWSTPSPPV